MSALTFNDRLIKMSDVLEYFALSLTKDKEQAQDLLQETLLKALTYKDKFAPDTNLKAWLHTIMKNTFINDYRKNMRARVVVTTKDNIEVLDFVPATTFAAPDSSISHKEILQFVNKLSDAYRVPFVMHFSGYKYKEIAEQLNIPIGTVKSRIYLAKQTLMPNLRGIRE
ncbi:MAG: RNA polymerase sigma factor [Flavobacteriales bacterium]|nr:RNA polymerase sigma factor [Flavobacteriales bacterium]